MAILQRVAHYGPRPSAARSFAYRLAELVHPVHRFPGEEAAAPPTDLRGVGRAPEVAVGRRRAVDGARSPSCSMIPRGERSNVFRIAWTIRSSGTVAVPNVSISTATGSATPIA